MTLFPEPIKPVEESQEQPIKVNPIETDKKHKEETSPETLLENWNKESRLTAAMLSCLQCILSFLDLAKNPRLLSLSSDLLTQSLYSLYCLFEKLKEADLSKDPLFCSQLSKSWNQLLDSHRFYKNPSLAKKISQLIETIDQFPPSQDHKLGYYFSNQVGTNWLPVPFMKILHYLYDDYQINQEQSYLAKWTKLLVSIQS